MEFLPGEEHPPHRGADRRGGEEGRGDGRSRSPGARADRPADREWEKTAARYRSEPETGEGTVELAERAKHAEHERDTKLAEYHNYELASAAFQIGIVLCSAGVITGMALLAWLAGGVAVVGVGLMGLGLFAPHLLHMG